jgi:CheY-like chemotaxis protein
VLLDLRMPGLDGASLVQLIRRGPEIERTTIVLHSSLTEETLARAARQCGADGYISKSGGLISLEQEIARWLGEPPA